MLTLHGICKNVFLTPQGVNKETGEAYGGRYKVQLEVQNELRNGEKRFDLVDLYTDTPDDFRKLDGKPLSAPVGCYVVGNKVGFFLMKGAAPVAQSASQTASASSLFASKAS